MNKRKELDVMDAVDQLSTMAEIDQASLEGKESSFNDWLDPAKAQKNQETVKETFRVIKGYLTELYEQDEAQLKDPQTQRGIQAIMLLAGEAAQKMDRCTALFRGAHTEGGVTELKEYQELQQFYLTKIMHKFQQSLEAEEAWQAEWGEGAVDVADIERRGLKDLETVRRDKEYELFYIRKEDGTPFFNRNLLRHIKLVGEFDETFKEPSGEAPFVRLQGIQDRELNNAAREILKQLLPYMDEFYKEAMRHKEEEFVASLNKALMALMLAANNRNLLQHTTGKGCLKYYCDFQSYLRQALASSDYQKCLTTPQEKKDRFSHALINLSHMLSCFFFLHTPMRKEMIEWIHRLLQKRKGEKRSGVSFWPYLLDSDEEIRAFLKRYPSGPLLKTLDVFREAEETMGFDPLSQGNFPLQMFTLANGKTHVSCIHLPSPTKQEFINEVEVAEEFLGFLRALASEMKQQKHLLINLQDRTSWQEHARSIALERVQKEEEFSKSLVVVTIAKNTPFYFQAENYETLNTASLFIEQFKEQIAGGEGCGFYFPPSLNTKEMSLFIDEAMQTIHECFFGGKETLTRKNRLDFIEIFYHFYALKLMEVFDVDLMSFTSKDAVDTGAATAAGFYAFMRLFSNSSSWSEEERDFLFWMLYAPALTLRERAIDQTCLSRFVSAMAILQAELESGGRKVTQKCQGLYRKPLFEVLKAKAA